MIDRRNLLRGTLLGAGIASLPRKVVASTTRAFALAPAVVPPGHQLLFVFQRGGNDGVNTMIPHNDPTYATARPTLAITNGIQLPGVTYSRLNPDLQRLQRVDLNGHLAVVHQAGDPLASRSHFTEMDMFEKGLDPSVSPTQAQIAQASGFVPSMLQQASIPVVGANNRPAALSLSPLMQTMFRAGLSPQVSAHIRDYGLIGAPALMQTVGLDAVSLQHGADHAGATNPLEAQVGYELAFGHVANNALKALNFSHAFATTGRFPLDPAELQQAAIATGSTVVPAFDGKGAAFMKSAEQAVFTLINSPETRVAGIEIGGWDTHANQATEQPNLLRYLGWGVRDMYDAIAAAGLGDRITIVVVTEFGRTAKENGAMGTDHGCGACYLVAGHNLKGGTYNIHDGVAPGPREFGRPWRQLLGTPTSPLFADAVEVRVGLREVLAEIMVKRVGVPVGSLGSVLPNYPPTTMGFLNFLM